MNENFDYKDLSMKVMDFTVSVECLTNAADILKVCYDYCSNEYSDIWHLDGLINSLMKEVCNVMEERDEVRKFFS